MKAGLFIMEILFTVIAMVSMLLVYQFTVSKNGELRKLMIAFFACQSFTVVWSGCYFFLSSKRIDIMTFYDAGILALLPLAISMLFILRYLIKQNRNKIKNNKP